MNNIRSEPLKDGQPIHRGGAPIARRHLDTARTPVRLLFGVLFVGYCAISTVLGVRNDLAPLAWSAQAIAGPLTAGLAIGAGVAVAIFIAEVLLAESAIIWYLPILALDAYYTQRWSNWLPTLIRAWMKADPFVEEAVALIVLWAAAFAVAYFGERLIFGKRRR